MSKRVFKDTKKKKKQRAKSRIANSKDSNELAEAHNNEGIALAQQNQLMKASKCFQQALAKNPNYAEAHNNLGIVLTLQKQRVEAVASFQRAIDLNPNYAEAYYNLGNTLRDMGELVKATEAYQRAIVLNPDSVQMHLNLGYVLQKQNQFVEAINCYQHAISLNPNYVDAYYNLGVVFNEQGKLLDASNCLQHALTLNPNYADAYYMLGNVRMAQVQLAEAVTYYQRALSLKPDFADVYNNFGIVLKDQGMIQKAIEHFRRALELKPNYAITHSNLLLTLNYVEDLESTIIFSEHLRFSEQHVRTLATSIQPYYNDRNPQRQLKIGYLSGDFWAHPVAYFMEPILAHHNQQQFEIFCYYNNTHIDNVTQRLQQYVKHWITCVGLSDDELADKIRQDKIDILIDLAGHTDKNRLMVFARKPAPVQITYLGYPTTTGLTTIDYRLTDSYVDSENIEEEPLNSETLVRMPDSYFCYSPYEQSPLTNELPLFKQGYLTFSSLNNYCKLSNKIKALWAEILKAVSGSKLLLKAKSLNDPTTRQALEEQFSRLGIEPERLILASFISSTEEHLRTYHQIDIGFDSYPYNGATTTCEAIWMGVPVVTLVGDRHASRMGLSILSTVGLTELIAYTPKQYVEICIKLANDTEYLQKIRSEMRERLLASPLMDGTTFTRHLEVAYRQMWEKWCK